MADRRIRIPETRVPGKRLGRHVNHDPRSLLYQVAPRRDAAARSASWKRDVPIFDQGELGSCTGNAGTGVLGSDPLYAGAITKLKLDEAYAVALYSDATKIDSASGSYPPDDTGSDGLSIAKVLRARGLISGFLNITSLDAAHTAIQSGPFITGVYWYESFDEPSSTGLVQIDGQPRGGHEFEVRAYDADRKLWTAANSWGSGWGASGYFSFTDDTYAQLLEQQGDATTFIPSSQPAPTPTPVPADSVWPAAAVDPWLAQRHSGHVARAAQTALIALRSKLTA